MVRFACPPARAKRNTCYRGGGGGGARTTGKVGRDGCRCATREGQPMTLTLALTTPLPPTGGARSLPRSSSTSRQDLCSPGRSFRREIGRWCHLPPIAPTSKVAGWWKVYLVGVPATRSGE
ncbi:hypothetical protein HN011_005453 [Eciton burchellii]|nr:hypothetical protein HN011_005453 [Eciton burchellii]